MQYAYINILFIFSQNSMYRNLLYLHPLIKYTVKQIHYQQVVLYPETKLIQFLICLSLSKFKQLFAHLANIKSSNNSRNVLVGGLCLKGQCHEIFFFWFSSRISFPQVPNYTIRPFWIFSKFPGDIRSSRFANGVNDTGGKWKKSSIRKILIIFFGHLWVVEETYI